MLPQRSRTPKLAFGSFEFDSESGELRKHGYKVKLPSQPGQILSALVERLGELWPVKTCDTAFGQEPPLVTSSMASTRRSTSSVRRSAMPPVNRAI